MRRSLKKHFKYKNTLAVLVIILILYFLLNNPATRIFIESFGSLGLWGAFVAGIFFVSSFTVTIAGVVLFFIAQNTNPLSVALIAGLGAVIGDFLIFRFFKDRVFEELRPLFRKIGGSRLAKALKSPFLRWLSPILGAVIIASPFPDEIGVGLMGLSKMKAWQFMFLAFILNAVGIYVIVSFANNI